MISATIKSLWSRIRPASRFDDELQETSAQAQAEETQRGRYLSWVLVFVALGTANGMILTIASYQQSHSLRSLLLALSLFVGVILCINSLRLVRLKKITPAVYYLLGSVMLGAIDGLVAGATVIMPSSEFDLFLFTVLFLPRREVARAMILSIVFWMTIFILKEPVLTYIFGTSIVNNLDSTSTYLVSASIPLISIPIFYQFRRISMLSKLIGVLSLLTLGLFVIVSVSAQTYAIETVHANAQQNLQTLAQTEAAWVNDWVATRADQLNGLVGDSKIKDLELNTQQLGVYADLLGEGAQVTVFDSAGKFVSGSPLERNVKLVKGEDIQFAISPATSRILIAIPFDSGILAVTYPAEILSKMLGLGKLGDTGEVDIFLPAENTMITSHHIEEVSSAQVNELMAMSKNSNGELTYKGDAILSSTSKVLITNWQVVAHQQISEMNLPAQEQGEKIQFLLAMAVGFLWLALVWFSQVITRPINNLKDVAQRVREGNYKEVAQVESTDEIGLLTGAFNRMTRTLRETLEGLEETVQSRTRDLNVAAQVSRQITSELDLEKLLPGLVEQTKVGFGLYYASVFLYDPESEELLLEAGTGLEGTHMKSEAKSFYISARPSVVAEAAREQKSVVINDVNQSTIYFKNPHLPKTQSEAVFPMIVGDELVGVLDLQAETTERFQESDAQIFSTLAEQIAIAVRNAQLYAAQEHVAQELARTDLMKSQFLASMSHELRTPLNAIINFTELVTIGSMGEINEQQREVLTHSLNSSKHLLQLINDVLDISKIQAGKLTLFVEEDVNLKEEITAVLGIAEPLLQKQNELYDRHVQLVTDIDVGLPLVNCDRRRVKQVLLNVLSNAIKFTDKGSITLSVKQQKDQIRFGVLDTGGGISEELQSQIFEPFIQTMDSVKYAEGTGLGLPIARSLIEAHGGSLWLESELGQGSAFFFDLPVTVLIFKNKAAL